MSASVSQEQVPAPLPHEQAEPSAAFPHQPAELVELQEEAAEAGTAEVAAAPIEPVRMESIVRVSQLPVVKETVNVACHYYGKVRSANCVFHWSLKKAELTVSKAVNTTYPMVLKLRKPIKKVDGVLCTGLDYVEEKVPGVKLPAREMYLITKQFVNEHIEPCKQRVTAVKIYSTKKLVGIKNCVCCTNEETPVIPPVPQGDGDNASRVSSQSSD